MTGQAGTVGTELSFFLALQALDRLDQPVELALDLAQTSIVLGDRPCIDGLWLPVARRQRRTGSGSGLRGLRWCGPWWEGSGVSGPARADALDRERLEDP